MLALRDSNAGVQRDALRALGRLRVGDAVDSIASFATDRVRATRVVAIQALGNIASPRALRALINLIGVGDDNVGPLDPSPVRDALVECGKAAAEPLVAVLETQTSPSIASSAAWVLGRLGSHAQANAIVDSMRRGVLPIAAALAALAGAGSPSDIPVVLEFVSSSNRTIRDQAMSTAASLLDPSRPDGRVVEPLAAALLESNTTPSEQARLAYLLGRSGAPRAAPLLASLAVASDASVRLAAIDSLGMIGASDGQEIVLAAMESDDAMVRVHAGAALGHIGDALAARKLVERIDSDDEIDRANAWVALGGILARYPDDKAVSRLASRLQVAVGAARDSVAEVIGRTSLLPALKVLGPLTTSSDPDDRRIATAMLAGFGNSPDARALVRARLADQDVSVRAQAAWSIGSIGDENDIAQLSALATVPSIDVATNAVAAIGYILGRRESLGHLGNPGTVLCPLAADERATVRANALAGLALAAGRCDTGAAGGTALPLRGDESVRGATAAAVSRAAAVGQDYGAPRRCEDGDPSGRFSRSCRRPTFARGIVPGFLAYVVPYGEDAPRAGAMFCMQLGDGFVRLGTLDRRGAISDPVSRGGVISLCNPPP
jgi:HEAT repeat protein